MAAKSSRGANGFDLTQSICYLLRVCDQQAGDFFARESSGGDLTRPQFMVLAGVDHHEGGSQTDLVGMVKIDRSTLAEMMRRMNDKGLLHRERTAGDARANAVRMTASGRKALRAGRMAHERVERALLAPLSPGDRTKLIKLLSMVAAGAEAAGAKSRRARRKPAVR
jgi:DNA-binding MarR family transcriptional regulator